MISVFLREQRRYTQDELVTILQCTEEKVVCILRRLKEYGVLKAVRADDTQRQLLDLDNDDVEVAGVEISGDECFYVFTFVGIVIIGGCVLKCYPKYIPDEADPKPVLKQVLKVLEKYNSSQQIIRMSTGISDGGSLNMLAIMLFLLQDYFDYGAYINTQDIIEINGLGETIWDKTINETFALLYNKRPYYPELLTVKRTVDNFDYFKRLHECVLTYCTAELQNAGLLDLFDMLGVDISDEELEDFGEKEYILDRIIKELNIQFNTRKQLLLKTLYAFVANRSALDDIDCISVFGINKFELVWQQVCSEVLDNQLQKAIGGLRLPCPLAEEYRAKRKRKLIDLIDKPEWTGEDPDKGPFSKEAPRTLIPDIITIAEVDGNYQFIIFDAKYYNLQLEPDKELRGQPGIEDITKQYLYHLAYKSFIDAHGIKTVKNCFLMPTPGGEVVVKGKVSLAMLSNLKLQDIQIRFVPAELMYRHYLENTKIDVGELLL